ncbi:hypothetical protein BDW71DRAFT_182473 [Aspergillus fruticulosus]
MLRKFIPALIDIFHRHCDSSISLIFLHSHQISQRGASNRRRFLCLLLTLSLLSPVSHDLAALPTKNSHVTLRVPDSGNRLQLLGEDRAAIEEGWAEVVDEQMDASALFIIWHKVAVEIASLGDAGGQHPVCLPVVNIFALCIAEGRWEVRALQPLRGRLV